MKWFGRSLQILCAISLLATSCGGASQPPAVPPQPISDSTGEFLNIQINYVGFEGPIGDTDGTGELQLITIVSDENGHSDALICPYGAIIEIQSGDLINPCNAVISYPQNIVGDNLYIMMIAVDNDDTGVLGDVTSGVVSTGLAFGLKEAIASAGLATTGSAPVVIGFLALDAVIGFAGGKVQEYFENSDVIGSQSFILSKTKDWNNNNPVVAKSEDGDVEFSFVIQQSATAGDQQANSASPVPTTIPKPTSTKAINQPAPTSRPKATATLSMQDPETFVRAYFRSVTVARDYEHTWNLLTNGFKEKNDPGGFSEYVDFWNKIDSVDLNSIDFYEHTSTSAKCAVNITFHANSTSQTVDVKYHLVYNANRKTWLFESP